MDYGTQVMIATLVFPALAVITVVGALVYYWVMGKLGKEI